MVITHLFIPSHLIYFELFDFTDVYISALLFFRTWSNHYPATQIYISEEKNPYLIIYCFYLSLFKFVKDQALFVEYKYNFRKFGRRYCSTVSVCDRSVGV
jgi:hypothetical protein